jgi:hypothetical protein
VPNPLTTNTQYEISVPTLAAFAVAGGGSVTLYLNSVMVSGGAAANDLVSNDYIVVEFHVTTP